MVCCLTGTWKKLQTPNEGNIIYYLLVYISFAMGDLIGLEIAQNDVHGCEIIFTS